MPDFYQLFDSRLKRNYIVMGDYLSLLPLSKLRLEPRNTLDYLILCFQKIFYKKKIEDSQLKILPDQLAACLLFNTEWYKETRFIGLIKIDEKISFIKMFGNAEDALKQQEKFSFIDRYFSDDFKTINIESSSGNTLSCNYVPYLRSVDDLDDIIGKIIQFNSDMTSRHAVYKSVNEIISADLEFILSDERELLALIDRWIKMCDLGIPVIPVHGDMTPWNMFVSENNEITLVDYEEAGWHVPYYDYFHYILQPCGLKSKSKPINDIIGRIDHPNYKQFLILYLIDQIYKHHFQIKRCGFNDRFIKNLIRNKTKWLREIIDER